MRKIIYLGIIAAFITAVFLRINKISVLAEQDAAGIEQYYKTNGIPVDVDEVKKGEFLVYCRVNAQVMGLKQTEISTPIEAKILKVHHKVGDMVRANEIIISLDKEDPGVLPGTVSSRLSTKQRSRIITGCLNCRNQVPYP